MDCEDCNSGKCTCGHEFGVHSSNCGIFKDAPRYTTTPDSERTMVDETEILKQLVEYLDKKINSALISHPNAVPILLQEARDRTHFVCDKNPEPLYTLEQAVEKIMAHENINLYRKDFNVDVGQVMNIPLTKSEEVIAVITEKGE